MQSYVPTLYNDSQAWDEDPEHLPKKYHFQLCQDQLTFANPVQEFNFCLSLGKSKMRGGYGNRNNAPTNDVHTLIPSIYEYVMLHDKGE